LVKIFLKQKKQGSRLGGTLKEKTMTKKETIDEIILTCYDYELDLPEQIAYVLATAEWETNHTFKPVKEAYWLSEGWRQRNLRYYPYYGRGFVQITWDFNYKKFSDILEVDLVGDPDMALEPNIATQILVYGFKYGTFTGRRLERYIYEGNTDFYHARRCINGLDKASEIAKLAEKYLRTLD
jgi:hypothetical protein